MTLRYISTIKDYQKIQEIIAMHHSLIMILRYGGDVHIDDDENWSVNSTRGVGYIYANRQKT